MITEIGIFMAIDNESKNSTNEWMSFKGMDFKYFLLKIPIGTGTDGSQ